MGSSITVIRAIEDKFVPLLQGCRSVIELKPIHAQVLRFGLNQSNFLATKMVDICDINGDIDYAASIFRQVLKPNVFLYNAMVRTYSHNGLFNQAISLYKQMPREKEEPISPDKFTFPFILKACAGLLILDLGKQIHSHICKLGPDQNTYIENALMDMYTKCGSIASAQQVFDEMREKDVVSWNALITGYARLGNMNSATRLFNQMLEKTIVSWTAMITGYTNAGRSADALKIFREMQLTETKPDYISILSILPACAQLGALEAGQWIHSFADKNGLLEKTCICNALIEMYAKCGSIEKANQVFNEMLIRDVISWTIMISGLASHGRAQEAINLYVNMKNEGIKPNSITYLGVLSACVHGGLVVESLKLFESMTKEHCIDPEVEHYGCIVDLYGRSGFLDEALQFVQRMPIKPDATIWGSLLSACRTHGNARIAMVAMERLLELEPKETGNYVLISNIYANEGRWDDVSRVRKLMRRKKLQKTPGCSSIEVNNVVTEFVVGDDSHPELDKMYEMLGVLAHQLKKEEEPSLTELALYEFLEAANA
ncbi:hypothetical protein AMTRI_Chr11g151940 [Amborella trichopoda]